MRSLLTLNAIFACGNFWFHGHTGDQSYLIMGLINIGIVLWNILED